MMKTFLIGVSFFLMSFQIVTGESQDAAILCSVSGKIMALSATGKNVPLQAFDWIAPETVIEIAAGSHATIVFRSGKRFELSENTKAIIQRDTLLKQKGVVKELPSISPLPQIAAISGEMENTRSGAIRIRSERIDGLYPDGHSASSQSTILIFDPFRGASRYDVQVEDEEGNNVFRVETEATNISVSPGILKPGSAYYWRVSTLDAAGRSARGEAEFTTLSEELESSRELLKKSTEEAGDAASLALLAEIDRRLGLVREAKIEIENALRKFPEDDSLKILSRKIVFPSPKE